MRKILIFLTLIAISLISFSCSKKPEVAIEDPLAFCGEWTMFFEVWDHLEGSTDIYYVLIDKDKNTIYTFTNYMYSYPFLGYGGRGIGLLHIFKDEPPNERLALIEGTLKQSNITNVIFSLWIKIEAGSNTYIFAGFDENITNVGSGIYGLGMYEGVFDGNGKITNVRKIIPIANYTNIPEFPGDFIWYDINACNISIKSGDASDNSLKTNISF